MKTIFTACGAMFIILATVSVANGSTIIDTTPGFSAAIQTGANGSGVSDNPAVVVVLNSASQTYNATQTASAGLGRGSASVNLSANQENMELHGSASASGFAPTGEAGGNGDLDLYWDDQFNILGSGTETFQYTLVLNGSVSTALSSEVDGGSSYAYGGLYLYENSSYQTWGSITQDCASSPSEPCGLVQQLFMGIYPPGGGVDQNLNGGTVTGTVTFQGGSSVDLGLYLWSRTSAGAPDGSAAAEFDASDTGYLILTPVTPGAAFTTSSGLTYESSPDAPEPASLAMFLTGMAGILALGKHKQIR